MESVPKIEELMPRVPIFPVKGAVMVLFCSLAITPPFLTFVCNFIGSSKSLFLILKEVVLLLNAVHYLLIV